MEELIPHLVCFTKIKTGLYGKAQPRAQNALPIQPIRGLTSRRPQGETQHLQSQLSSRSLSIGIDSVVQDQAFRKVVTVLETAQRERCPHLSMVHATHEAEQLLSRVLNGVDQKIVRAATRKQPTQPSLPRRADSFLDPCRSYCGIAKIDTAHS
jgi:hypothetical protein